MSRLIRCDRCGNEITDQKIFAIKPQAIREDGTALNIQPFDGEGAWDYCERCAKAVIAFLHQKPAGENPPNEKIRKEKIGAGHRQGAGTEESRMDDHEDCGRDGRVAADNKPVFKGARRRGER